MAELVDTGDYTLGYAYRDFPLFSGHDDINIAVSTLGNEGIFSDHTKKPIYLSLDNNNSYQEAGLFELG